MKSIRYNRIWLSTALLCASVSAKAQQVDNMALTVSEDSARTSVIVDGLMIERIASLEGKLNEKEAQIALLVQEISRLKSDLDSSRHEQAQQNDIVRQLNDTISVLRSRQSVAQRNLERLKEQMERLDGVIYKQCLLYPLEAKYNETNVREAITSIEQLSELLTNPSEKFKKYKDTYLPLVRDYKRYNEDLIQLIESHTAYLFQTGWIIGFRSERFRQDIEQMDYYTQCYLNRNKSPYRSIIYLDNIIERYIKILDNTEESVKSDIEDLLASLR